MASSTASEWDRSFPSTSTYRMAPASGWTPAGAAKVVDDWEDEDDEDEQPEQTGVGRNQRLWESANGHEPAPMPTVVLTSTSAPVPLAPAAFQPQLRILKRPTTATAPAPAPPTPPGESLKEREARYQAARERIFGTEDTVEKKKAGGVVRNPKGPSDTLNSDPKGFSSPRTRTPPERRKKTSGG